MKKTTKPSRSTHLVVAFLALLQALDRENQRDVVTSILTLQTFGLTVIPAPTYPGSHRAMDRKENK